MNKVIYLSRFIKEIEKEYQNILAYTQSENTATSIHNEILDNIDRLEILPQIGQIERNINGDVVFRSLIVLKNYKVYYFIENENVYIFSLWNCRRNPKSFNVR